ncbi:MAG: Gfo/Idh/MocA family oxidoreductase [Elusimicrobiota bacterium]|jgi:predicted dehydrogenase|nr:Gfo/Idh/MocA family oxidoreductase [Elusimicrobiota bacterium]
MRVAVIGSGIIVDKFIEALKMTKGASLEAVFSRTDERASAFATKHSAKKFYSDMDTMLQDPDIDTIYIASPNSLHFEHSKKALQAGKNVINEKPFTSTLQETKELFDLAKTQNRFIFEAITTIHLPNYQIIKDNLSRCGNIKILTLNFSQFSKRYLTYMAGQQTNIFDPKFSGGSLYDINVYNIHFVVGLLGKPKSYKYYPNIGTTGVDTSGVLIMVYDNFVANLIAAKDSESGYMFYVQGDKGTIRVSESSSGVCKNVGLFLQGDSQPDGIAKFAGFSIEDAFRPIGIEQKQHMSYEVEAFAGIIKNNDFAAYEKLKKQTLDVMEILYNCRIDAGIKFSSDDLSKGGSL